MAKEKVAKKNNASANKEIAKATNDAVVDYIPNGDDTVLIKTTTTTTTTTTTKRFCINNKNPNFNLNQVESILDKDSNLENNKLVTKRKAIKNAKRKSSNKKQKNENKSVSLSKLKDWMESDNERMAEDEFLSRPSGLLTAGDPNTNGYARNLRKRSGDLLSRSGSSNSSEVFDCLKSGKSPRLSGSTTTSSSGSSPYLALRNKLFNQNRSQYIDDLINEFTSDVDNLQEAQNSDSLEKEKNQFQPATHGKDLSAIFEKTTEQDSSQNTTDLSIKSPPASVLSEMVANHLSINRNIKISPDKNGSIQSPFESLINQSVLQSTQLGNSPIAAVDIPSRNSRNMPKKSKSPLKPRNKSSPKNKQRSKIVKKPPIKSKATSTKTKTKNNISNSEKENKGEAVEMSSLQNGNNTDVFHVTSQPNAITIYSPNSRKYKKRQDDSIVITKENVKKAIGSRVNDKLDDNFQLKINSKAQFVYVPDESSTDGIDSAEADIFKAYKKKRQSLFIVSE